ncbi:transmembrane protein, putative [Medicago truncatula]|uniref:Transmembrane protein, putative n=1 Tax=Medicago truncatula TaxID=3880 RepID=G7K6W5_MEDTR|nr:transmembrane protein, putative [Medicago truncatula]
MELEGPISLLILDSEEVRDIGNFVLVISSQVGKSHHKSLLMGFSCVAYVLHYCIGWRTPQKKTSYFLYRYGLGVFVVRFGSVLRQ